MDALVPLLRLAQQQAGPCLTAFEFMSARAMEFVQNMGRRGRRSPERMHPASF